MLNQDLIISGKGDNYHGREIIPDYKNYYLDSNIVHIVIH